MVNGFRFHTRAHGIGKRTQNSGVLVRGDELNPKKEYYGVIEQIYELSYVGNKKVYLFKCHWWDVSKEGTGYKIDKYDIISVNAGGSLSTTEPFVLASQAEQVFYVDDMSKEGWLVVVKTNPRDLFNMPAQDESDDDLEELEAYQQLEVEGNVLHNDNDEVNIDVALHRNGVQSQSIILSDDEDNEDNRPAEVDNEDNDWDVMED